MAYKPPYARKSAKVAPVPSVDIKSETLFPSLSANVQCARNIHETSLASRAAAWNEALTMKSSVSEERLREDSIEEARAALRAFYNMRPPEQEYVRSDDVYQDRLDEIESMEAIAYNEEHPDEEPLIESEWVTTAKKETRHRTSPVQKQQTVIEYTPDEIRERITFLEKRLRRNGILREDKEAHEKELRELHRMMYDSD